MQVFCSDCSKPLGAYHTSKVSRCHRCAALHSKRLRKPSLPFEAGCAMVPGTGERNETCSHYSRCLMAFANASHGDGHCPDKCRYFVATPQRVEMYAEGWTMPGNGY